MKLVRYPTNAISYEVLFDHFQFTLIHGPSIPGSYARLFFTTSDFTSITSHIHNWALFSLWLHLFILSGVTSPVAYWAPTNLGSSSFSVLYFAFSYCSWGSQGKNTGLSCPSPVDHILSKHSTMTHPSWVALHGMAHSFIELDKAVVHVISLVSFLWL